MVHLSPHIVEIFCDQVDLNEVGFPLLLAEIVVNRGLIVIREVLPSCNSAVNQFELVGPMLCDVL